MTEQPPLPPVPGRAERRRRSRRNVAAVGSAAALATSFGALGLGGAVAGAAALSVTTCDDSGPGSLRQAILDANGDVAADTITITATCTGVSAVPVASVMEITEDLTITGPGAADFVLDGGGTSGIMRIPISYGSRPDLTITGVTFTDAGGTYAALSVRDFDAVVVDHVVFADNHHTQDGGAMACPANGTSLSISNTSFVGNESDGSGGALMLECEATVTITDTLFADNTAYADGGAIEIYEQEGEVLVANSTFSGNVATSGNGGAVYGESLYTSATFLFDTVVDNTAYGNTGGLFMYYVQYDATIRGTISSGNSGHQAYFYSVGGTITTADNDFFGTVSGFTPDATDLNVDPQLQPLADNGGPTLTRALAATSPVIDHGPTSWTTFAGDEYDQRGAPHARVVNGRSDMGAYEYEPVAPPPEPTPDPSPEPTFTG